MILVFNGHPGAGKTHTASSLAARIQERSSCLVLHTDILKVTLRQMGVEGLRGLSCTHDAHQRSKVMEPFLKTHVDKALRDGLHLIIEGTLALGFDVHKWGYNIEIQCSKEESAQRRRQKPIQTQERLHTGYSYEEYEKVLQAHRPPNTIIIDGEQERSTRIESLLLLFGSEE